MKRLLLVGIIIAGMGLLGIGLIIPPTLAHEANDVETTLSNQEPWEEMYEDCYHEGYHVHEDGDRDREHGDYWGHIQDHMGEGMMHW